MPNITADIKRLIDSAFQRSFHNNGYWKTTELIDFLYEKIDQQLSERTIRNYIERLRADGAPIIADKGLGYKYAEKWSLSENPLTEEDIKNLRAVINILSQFKGFKFFNDAEFLINKLQEKVVRTEDTGIILDTNNLLKGLEYIDEISVSIKNKEVLEIEYKPYGSADSMDFTISPYKLIEYNNRWFLFGKAHFTEDLNFSILPLDRIIKIKKSNKKFKTEKKEVIRTYFKDIVGVTNHINEEVENVKFRVYGTRANYIETKPVHRSLKVVKKNKESTEFSLQVKLNLELESFILGFGKDIEVLSPAKLKNSIKETLEKALDNYKKKR